MFRKVVDFPLNIKHKYHGEHAPGPFTGRVGLSCASHPSDRQFKGDPAMGDNTI
jgi:hypothetical protein